MERDRTNTTHEEPADPRIACSDSHRDSKPSRATEARRDDATSSIGAPRRVGESDHQGARAGDTRRGGSRKATAVARLKGGASPSTWTRRTRPWNASTPDGRRRLHSSRPPIDARGVLRRRGTGGRGGGIHRRTPPACCPQGQPHPRLPRSASSRAGETGAIERYGTRPGCRNEERGLRPFPSPRSARA